MTNKYILNEKWIHLTDEQVSDLLKRYFKGEKIVRLIEEFKIECVQNNFNKYLPQVLDPKIKCLSCGSQMAKKLVCRSNVFYVEELLKCTKCQHLHKDYCRCEYCLDVQYKINEAHQQSLQSLIENYCKTYITKHEELSVNYLTFEEAVALVALVRICPVNEHGSYDAIYKSLFNFAPRGSLLTDKVVLLLDKEIIRPSATSDISAFILYEGKIESFEFLKVNWELNCINPHSIIAEIENCGLLGKWPQRWFSEVYRVRMELALAECQEYYEHCLEQRKITYFKEVTVDNLLKNILRDHSVAQCYRIIWCGATASSDFKARSQANPIHTKNYMAGACQRWADKARAEGWAVEPYRRNFNLPRSMLSQVLYDVMLKIGEKGFNEVITEDFEWFKYKYE